eukprot:GEMP01012896.1.p1 GENE.GEMP01012896.1~~GEMP01012896.1.p1  ORF type:complete len:716 (+),score=217.29 GEMP01012896.1:106-2253(+)
MIVSLLLAGFANSERSFLKAYSRDFDTDGGPTPVQRVTKLLSDMKSQLEKEASNDKELYDQLVCWCKDNDKEKRQAISNAEGKISDLVAEIEERSGRQGTLTTEIEQLKKNLQKNVKSLATAEELRNKDQASFREEQKDLVQAIGSLKNAVQVLSKHQAGLLELNPELRQSLKSVLHYIGERHRAFEIEKGRTPQVLLSVESGASAEFVHATQGGRMHVAPLPEEYASRVVASFVQGAQPVASKSYNGRSGQIFGIMQTMQEEFEKKLKDAQVDEARANEEFLELEKAKKSEIAATEKQIEEKTAEAADNGKQLADAKEDIRATRETLSADKEFLRNLTLQCQSIDHQWAQRTKTRSDEIAAIAEALTILQDDDTREQLGRTTFIQLKSTAKLRKRAIDVLTSDDLGDLESIWKGRAHVEKTPKRQLAALAVQVSLDGFEKVKAAMDKMVAELKAQQKEDDKHKDFCEEEFNNNDKAQRDGNYKREDLQTKIEGLENTVQSLNSEIAQANKDIANLQVEVKRAGEDREKENAEFQTEVADQRATQQILAKVLTRLNEFYKKKGEQAAALLAESEGQVPPVTLGAYKKNAGASPVLSLIEKIIEDSKAAETEAITDEKQSQKDYERFVKDSNTSIGNLQKEIVQKSDSVASARTEKETTTVDHKFTLTELEELAEYRADLHGECDFLVKNHDLRRQARTQEREAIAQAKAILSGQQ